jgi:hypothetical protein
MQRRGDEVTPNAPPRLRDRLKIADASLFYPVASACARQGLRCVLATPAPTELERVVHAAEAMFLQRYGMP